MAFGESFSQPSDIPDTAAQERGAAESAATQTKGPTVSTRRASLSVRLALLLASLLVVSALATAVYATVSVRGTQSANASQSMANVHGATRALIDQGRVWVDQSADQ